MGEGNRALFRFENRAYSLEHSESTIYGYSVAGWIFKTLKFSG